MDGIRKKPIIIKDLEKRLMFDASLGNLAASTTLSENLTNASPQILDNDVSVTGSTTNFDGLALDISTDGGASDQISIRDEGTGFGDIGFDGTNITYSGTQIGTVSSNGTNGSNLTIDLNGNADKTAIENLIENITYQTTSDDPAIARNISFALDALFSETITVNISPDNDTPSINTNTGMTLDEGDTQTLTSAMLGISDPDNADDEVTITLNNILTHGRLELTSATGVAITDFTLEDLNNGDVQYVHDDTNSTSDSFNFTVSDGDITLAAQDFDITITPVDDAPVLENNGGADVFEGFSTDIGGTEVPAQFGTTLLDRSTVGQFGSFEGIIDSNDITQLRIIITTPAAMPTANPGQVIFETGGSGRGIGLILNENNELEFYAGNASTTPEIVSPIALSTSTQYAIVVELDQPADELRLHYAQSNDFDWYQYGRVPEAIDNNFTDPDYSGGNGSGVGVRGNNSLGGYNGGFSGNLDFQGSIDSHFIISQPPAGGTIIQNTNLVYNDSDTTTNNIIYTVTTDVTYGTLYNDGVAIGLGDTFTQADLDAGDIDYIHDGGATPDDSFGFSVSDGNTTLTGNTYAINVISGNTAPTTPDDTFTIAENANNGDNVGQVEATDPDTAGGQVLTYTITSGNTDGIFQIDAASGLISVADNTSLDYETTTSYTLTVRATDDGPGTLFDEGTITINIQDIYEGTAPVFTASGPFSIDENVGNNTVVGTITTTDAEGDNVSYSIRNGNTNNAFKINNSGVIQVNGDGKIDFEQNASYTLTIRATDDSVDNLFRQQNVTININDLNEAPTLAIDEVIGTIDKTVSYFADNGNFYKYFNNNVNFNTALNNAAAATLNGANGHLVTITSADENSFVHGVRGNHIWLAASDADVEGQWKWIAGPESGSVFSQGGTATAGFYERWAGSEPNSGSGANVAYMNNNTYWYDQGGGSRHYVVEWESMDVINNRTYSLDYSTPGGGDINNGDSLGFVQGGDDDGDTITYSITAGNGDGIFEIDTSTGELRIADDTNINTAVNSDYTLTVRVDDGNGLFDTKDIDINFNQLLSIGANNTLAATEGASTTITTSELNIVDNDTPAADLTISITSQPSHGQLELTTDPGVAINSFTQDDLANNRVIFVSNGDENTADSFEFSVSDGSYSITGQTFDISITNTNDSPVISTNTGTTVLEGGSRVITNAMLDSLDSDDVASGLTYTASNYSNGHIEVDGNSQNTFTQADIDAGDVRFIHDGSEGNGSFDIELADSGADGATTDTATFTLTKTDVNDAPVIANNTGTSVTEGQSVIITNTMLSATDIDDNNADLVYTVNTQLNGNFRYVSAPTVPITTFTQDDIDNNAILFQHDGNEQDGVVEFSVADDGDDGASPATGTFTITKIPVNDAPTISVNTGTSVDQDGIVILKNSVLAAADTDDAPSGIDYTIDSVHDGQLEYLANPNVAITSFTQDDINNSLVIFRHTGPSDDPASFDFTIADGGENSAGTASGTFNLTVDNTNNSPDITTNAAPTMNEGTTITLDTTMLDSFDPDDFGSDLTWTVTNLQSGIVQVNSVTQDTFTQADLDNGDVTFTHDGSQTLTAGFTVTLADGGENNATTDTEFFAINIDQINNLPTIDANTGDTLAEGGTATIDNTELATSDSDINEADWYDGNWDYRQKITLESDYVDADLTDFALMINGDSFSRAFWDNVKADGSDIVVTLADGTKLSRELVSINRGAETMELHVSVPNVSSTVDTELFIYYGNFAASETNDAATVFTNYDHVYHMNNLNAVDVIGANNGTNSGGGSITTGIMGNAHSYNGSGIVDIATITGNDVASISFWYRPEGQGGGDYGSLLGSDDYNDGIRHISTDEINLRSGGNITLSSTPDFDTYKHMVFSYDQGSGTINLYENGVLQDTSAFTGWYDIEHLVGISGDDSRAIDGIVDEIRITDAVITQEQAAAEYANQATPSAFYSLSGQQQYVPEVLTYTVTTASANGTLYLDANSNGSLDGGEALALNDTFTQDDIDNGLLLYTHDGGETTTDSFGYTISDADGTTAAQTFNFTVTAVNDTPVISTNTGPTINEGDSVTLTTAMLDVTDPDDADADLLWSASNLANGTIEVNGNPQNTFTHAQLVNGDVTFIHDGGETISAGFDIQIADDDGANNSGSFSITVTPVNDAPTLILNDGDPNIIDLNDYTINSYGGSQDAGGTITVSPDGSTLTMSSGNMWKQITTPYTLTANTVLSFEFFADASLEIQGIGFENDGGFGFIGYELLGSQNWQLNDDYRGYQVGDGWVRYDIDIGADYTGVMNSLVFAMDNDGNDPGSQAFRNINFYESDQIVDMDEGGSLTLTNTHLNSVDPDDTPANRIFTATNVTNGHIEVDGNSQNTFTQEDINNGDVVFIHDDSETLTAGFDIALTDDDGAGTDTGRFDIIVNAVDEAPLAATNNGLSTNEGATTTITTAALTTSDIDTESRNVVFTLTDNVDNGHIALSSNTAAAINSFTLADLEDGNVVYVHDGSETTTDSFDFTVSDGTNTLPADTFNITVTPVNDAVNLATNTGANVGESDAVTITNAMLNTTDVDNTAAQITYTITDINNGWVELTTKAGFPVSSFTQSDLDNNRVVFRHDGSGETTASFDFSVNDTGADGTSPATGTFDLNVTPPLNEAPVIALSDGTPTTIDFSTTTVSPYDPSGVGDGQSGTPTNFEVSGDGSVLSIYGNAWKRIPLPMTVTSDTVLTFDFRSTKEGEIHGIGFDDNNDFVGSDNFYEFFGTDANGGFNQTYNTYSLGDGWTRYEIPVGNDFTGAFTQLIFVADDDSGANSDAISQFRNVSIYEANPTITANEGGAVTLTNANLNAFDTDDAPDALTYTVTNLANGHIEVDGNAQNTFTQEDINNGDVRFIHDGSNPALDASFDIALTDDDGAGSDTATINMTVNDAPQIAGDLSIGVNEGGSTTITNTDLNYNDADDVAADITFTATNLTNGHIEVNGNPQNTFTQADINAGDVAFIHDGSETLSAGFDISIIDDGGAGTDTASMTITVTPVNDNTPSDITMDNASIAENSANGTQIGQLGATDADSVDSMTYSLLDDAGGLFRVDGNNIVVNGALDYEAATTHSITVQVEDQAGQTFDKAFTIMITDVSEGSAFTNNNVTQDTNRNSAAGNNSTSPYSNIVQHNKRALFSVSDILNPENLFAPNSLIASTIHNGPGLANDGAFYGDTIQILRDNTAVILQTLPGLQESIVVPLGSLDETGQTQSSTGVFLSDQNTAENDLHNFMEKQDRLKQALLELENMDSSDADAGETDMGIFEITSIDDQFRNVLTYQQQKQAALREALLKS